MKIFTQTELNDKLKEYKKTVNKCKTQVKIVATTNEFINSIIPLKGYKEVNLAKLVIKEGITRFSNIAYLRVGGHFEGIISLRAGVISPSYSQLIIADALVRNSEYFPGYYATFVSQVRTAFNDAIAKERKKNQVAYQKRNMKSAAATLKSFRNTPGFYKVLEELRESAPKTQ